MYFFRCHHRKRCTLSPDRRNFISSSQSVNATSQNCFDKNRDIIGQLEFKYACFQGNSLKWIIILQIMFLKAFNFNRKGECCCRKSIKKPLSYGFSFQIEVITAKTKFAASYVWKIIIVLLTIDVSAATVYPAARLTTLELYMLRQVFSSF